MSAICGIVSFCDESSVSEIDLNLMVTSLAHRGSDGSRTWIENSVGLGQQKIDITPESVKEILPFHKSENNLTIVADARIDNRADLFISLDVPKQQRNNYTDSYLILTAYEKWGERCPEFLLGDFSFAIWDCRERKLFCCRDHRGIRSFFYYHDTKRFIFASEPKAITEVRGVEKKFNKNKLTTYILPEAKSKFFGESWFENIFSLPAGTSLTVDARGVRKRKYWEPPFVDKLPYKSDEEILEAFQSLMFEVVGARLRSEFPVTATLSGGLDSSAIVSVAARILEKENKPFHTFSAVLPEGDSSSLTDERDFINQFSDWKNVRLNFITAPQLGPFDYAEQMVWLSDSPTIIASNYLYKSFAEAAQSLNSRVILDGGGGELGASFHGADCYAEMFFKLRWLYVWRELNLRKKQDGHPLWRIFRSHILKPLVPSRLLPKKNNGSIYHPLMDGFAQSLINEISPNLKSSKLFSNRFPPDHRRSLHHFQKNSQQKTSGLSSVVGDGNIRVAYPLLDKRLLEFCLAAPTDLKIRDGHKRYLIRAGLDKILPPKIQWRNSKGAFSPDYLRRYNAQRNQVRDFLRDVKQNDPVREIVDIEKLKRLADLPVGEHEAYTFAEIAARDLVPQGIYLIYFLRRFSEFQN